MSFEVDPSLSQSTSRRTIVRTGVKLAYAAPLVAASMSVRPAGATPVSGPTCAAGYLLINGGCFKTAAGFADFGSCPNGCGGLACNVDGSSGCVCFGASTTTICYATSQCDSGQACDMGQKVCLLPC